MDRLFLDKITSDKLEEVVDVYIETFTREPWNDVYESRQQVVKYMESYLDNNYFLGYLAYLNDQVVGVSIGMKKPWIEGMEYYIDEFCIDYKFQARGIGSWFIGEIEKDIIKKGMNGIILNTEEGLPSYDFYLKNGFRDLKELKILVK